MKCMCIECEVEREQVRDPDIGNFEVEKKPGHDLWDADPNCDHDIVSGSGGGIRCRKCAGWFCY